jgi:hypothetical protein
MVEEATVMVRAMPIAVLFALVVSPGCNPADPAADPAPVLERAVEVAAAPSAIGGGPRAALTREDAIERVARARCDKLRDCPATLVDRYQSAVVCLGRERARAANMWDNKCVKVDGASLETCARAARAERCDGNREALFAPLIGACAPTAICPTSSDR